MFPNAYNNEARIKQNFIRLKCDQFPWLGYTFVQLLCFKNTCFWYLKLIQAEFILAVDIKSESNVMLVSEIVKVKVDKQVFSQIASSHISEHI